MRGKIKYIHNIGDVIGDCILLEYKGYSNGCKIFKIKCGVCGREREVRVNDLRMGIGNTHKNCIFYVDKDNKYFKRFRICWLHMRDRTTNPNSEHYNSYGGRNITSESYKLFIDFYDDMFESYKEHVDIYGFKDTTLERIDVNGNYVKENIKWATWKEQHNNTQRTKLFEATSPIGEKIISKNQTEFSKQYNIDYSCINQCLQGKYKQVKGWTFKFITEDTND